MATETKLETIVHEAVDACNPSTDGERVCLYIIIEKAVLAARAEAIEECARKAQNSSDGWKQRIASGVYKNLPDRQAAQLRADEGADIAGAIRRSLSRKQGALPAKSTPNDGNVR